MDKKQRIGIQLFLFSATMTFGYTSDEMLVTHGPEGDFKAQVEYLRKTSPKQYAILVVEVTKSPKYFIPEGPADSGDIEYCDVEVTLKDAIAIVWLQSDPKSPDDRFQIHYWYPKNRKHEMIS